MNVEWLTGAPMRRGLFRAWIVAGLPWFVWWFFFDAAEDLFDQGGMDLLDEIADCSSRGWCTGLAIWSGVGIAVWLLAYPAIRITLRLIAWVVAGFSRPT